MRRPISPGPERGWRIYCVPNCGGDKIDSHLVRDRLSLGKAIRLYLLQGENMSTPPRTVETGCGEIIYCPIPQQGTTVIDAVGTHLFNLPDRLIALHS